MTFKEIVRHFEREGYPHRKAVRLACEEVLAPFVTIEEAKRAAKKLDQFRTVQGFEVDRKTLKEAIKMAEKLRVEAPLAPNLALFPAAAGAIHHAVAELYTELMNRYGWPEAVAEAWAEVKKKHGLKVPSIVLLPSRASRALHSEVLETAHRIFRERTGKSASDVLKEAWAYYGYPEGPEKEPPKPKRKAERTYKIGRKQFKAIAQAVKAWAKIQHEVLGDHQTILPPPDKSSYASSPLPKDSALVRYGKYYYVLPHTAFKVLYDTKVKEVTIDPRPEGLFVDWGTGRWQFRGIKEDKFWVDLKDLDLPIPTLEDVLEGKLPKKEEKKRSPSGKEEAAAEKLAIAAVRLAAALNGEKLYLSRRTRQSPRYLLKKPDNVIENLTQAFQAFEKAWRKAAPSKRVRALAVVKMNELPIWEGKHYLRQARQLLLKAHRDYTQITQLVMRAQNEFQKEKPKPEAKRIEWLYHNLRGLVWQWYERGVRTTEQVHEYLAKEIYKQPRYVRIVLHDLALNALQQDFRELPRLLRLSYSDRQLARNNWALDYYPTACATSAALRWLVHPDHKTLPDVKHVGQMLWALYGYIYAVDELWKVPPIRRTLAQIWDEGIRLIPNYYSIIATAPKTITEPVRRVTIPSRWIVNEFDEYEILNLKDLKSDDTRWVTVKGPQGEFQVEISEMSGAVDIKICQILEAIARSTRGNSKKAPKRSRSAPWLTDAPFTKEDADRYNRYTHFETTAEEMNRRFRQDVAKYEEWVREWLSKYGIEEIPQDVRRALEGYRKALYEWEMARIRAREIAPPVSVVGPANYKGNPDKARRMEERAMEALEKAKKRLINTVKRYDPNAPIHSDDPQAIEKLKARIERLKKQHEEMKRINELYRKWKRDPGSVPAELHQKFREIQAKRKKEPWVKDIPYPEYALRNSLANIRRLEQRLKQLEELKATSSGEEEFSGGRIIDNAEISRVQIVFDEVPPPEVRAALKSRGFRWSPKNKAWQRKRTPQALQAAREIIRAHYGGA